MHKCAQPLTSNMAPPTAAIGTGVFHPLTARDPIRPARKHRRARRTKSKAEDELKKQGQAGRRALTVQADETCSPDPATPEGSPASSQTAPLCDYTTSSSSFSSPSSSSSHGGTSITLLKEPHVEEASAMDHAAAGQMSVTEMPNVMPCVPSELGIYHGPLVVPGQGCYMGWMCDNSAPGRMRLIQALPTGSPGYYWACYVPVLAQCSGYHC